MKTQIISLSLHKNNCKMEKVNGQVTDIIIDDEVILNGSEDSFDDEAEITDEQVKEREKALKETETFRENVLRNFCGIANFAKIREKCSGTCTHRLQAKSAYWLTGAFSLIFAVDVDRFLLEMVFLFFTTRQKEDDRKKRSNTEAGERSGIPWLLIRL